MRSGAATSSAVTESVPTGCCSGSEVLGTLSTQATLATPGLSPRQQQLQDKLKEIHDSEWLLRVSAFA